MQLEVNRLVIEGGRKFCLGEKPKHFMCKVYMTKICNAYLVEVQSPCIATLDGATALICGKCAQ